VAAILNYLFLLGRVEPIVTEDDPEADLLGAGQPSH
jgi:ACS family glucarate transporter-like MFS transporter